MDSVSSTLSSESSVSFSESDTDASSIQSLALFQLAHSLPDDIATAAAEGDLTVVRRWLEARWSLTDPTLMEPSGYDEDEDERDVRESTYLREVNASDEDGWTLLLHACTGPQHDDEYESRDDEAYDNEIKIIKELLAGVRREGSWLAFRRAEQKASFRLWWLVARGRTTTADPLLGRVAGLPNELRSKVLGYWCLAE